MSDEQTNAEISEDIQQQADGPVILHSRGIVHRKV